MNRSKMNRTKLVVLGSATVLILAACSSAGTSPNWTYAPEAAVAPAAAPAAPATAPASPTPIPATPIPATPTPQPPTSEPALGTKDAPRVIGVTMGNFFFEPGSITVHAGETIRFVITNPTEIAHEMVIGTAEEQEHHAQEMAAGMDHEQMGDHDDAAEPNELEVEAGETGELVWTFDQAGEFLLGCHVAGHWEAGMKGTVEVEG